MITKIYLKGFKSFEDPIIADVNDLTVIAGSNSCGKSSLIQALLLLSQTLENPRPEVALDLGGRFVQFAEFKEAVFGRPKNIDASFIIGFDLDIEEKDIRDADVFFQKYSRRFFSSTQSNTSFVLNKASIRICFRVSQSGTPLIAFAQYEKKVANVGTYNFTFIRRRKNNKISYKFIPQNKEASEISEKIKSFSDNFKEAFREVIKLPTRSSNLKVIDVDPLKILEGMSPSNFDVVFERAMNYIFFSLPGSKARQLISESKSMLTEFQELSFSIPISRSSIIQSQFDHFLFSPPTRHATDSDEAYYFERFNKEFGEVENEVKRFLQSIQYIGPLRAKPERAYLSTGTPIEIGNAGENAVPILWVNQKEKVINKTKIGEPVKEQTLEDAVKSWLGEFGIASEFHITKPKRVIYQAEMESAPGSNVMVTIADVGFGVSQLLPVIVAGLWAKKGSTLILEQPEIHLHPRLQGKLADFLICLAELDKKVIVETHSEHLINMLRLRIIQDESEQLQKHIGIIFVKSREQIPTGKQEIKKQGSYIENLKVDEYGKITNWPPDFFPESSQIDKDILRAMLDKSIKQKK